MSRYKQILLRTGFLCGPLPSRNFASVGWLIPVARETRERVRSARASLIFCNVCSMPFYCIVEFRCKYLLRSFMYYAIRGHRKGVRTMLNNIEQRQFSRGHGSLYDRGSADYYYRRTPDPHWYPNGTGMGGMILAVNTAERAEYMAGFDECDERKDWR